MLDTDSRSRAWAEIDLGAMRSNVEAIAKFTAKEAKIMAVVKADAYGHGILRTANEVISAGSSWLGIASVSEGAFLREADITAQIALLSAPAVADAADIVKCGLTAMVGDTAMLDALCTHRSLSQSELAVHLDIDTGMGRSGVLPKYAVSLWQYARSLGISVEGISTHFADADNADDGHTRDQLRQYEQTRQALHEAGATFKWTHIDNSASLTTRRLPLVPPVPPVPGTGAACNLIRPGLLLYGITPIIAGFEWISVLPTLALKARIATIRELPQNHAISYGVTHRLKRNSRVATVSIGYGDGYPRALSNQGCILVQGRRAPILGSVCMDQTVVDVTDIPGAAAGDEVVCIGRQGDEVISVEQIAGLIGATMHEVTTGITGRVPRVYL